MMTTSGLTLDPNRWPRLPDERDAAQERRPGIDHLGAGIEAACSGYEYSGQWVFRLGLDEHADEIANRHLPARDAVLPLAHEALRIEDRHRKQPWSHWIIAVDDLCTVPPGTGVHGVHRLERLPDLGARTEEDRDLVADP